MTGAINALSMRRNFTPEPFAWDRNDIGFRYRKHDKISGGDAQNSSRWRAPRHPPSSYHRRGWTPSRYDDGFQSSNGRYNGGRGSRRESRGYLRRSAIRRHVAPMRSVAAPISSPPPPPPPPLPLKDLYDKNSGDDDDQRLDQDRDQECSFGLIGWKLLKWKRRGSISSVETEEGQEVRKGSLEVTVAKFGEEMAARFCESLPVRKKPRLKWGQGLAMYEKQKVGGLSNSETTSKVLGLAGSMAPITPCSVACSSSGTKDRTFNEALNAENDTSHCREASAVDTQNCSEEPHVKLDQLPPVSMLTSLNDLLHAEATCTGDSTFSRNTAKLQSFKADILNELEKSECEIDLLENELKSLYEDGKYSSSPPCVESANVASKVSSNLSQVVSSPLTVMREPAKQICLSIKHKFKVSYSNGKILQTPPSYNGKPVSSGTKEPPFLDLGESAVTGNGFGSSSTNVTLNMSSSSKKDNNLMDLIMASNRNASQKASQAFRGAFPTSPQQFDIWESDRLSSCRRNDMRISERLALYKHQIRFKEHVLALKFRAFHHLWMDDLQLLSIKNKRLKSQKCFELCSSQWSSRRNHSIQSRSKLLAGNSALVPSANIVDFTSNLLSGKPQIKLYRENLKMPALILDEKERRNSRFVTNNNLIEDPISFEKERSMINPWTEEERGGFMEMLAMFGKDFVKISSFLSHKTTADCIEFYYKNHKSESFKDVKKQLDLRKQRHCISANSYHVTSGENIIHGSKVAQRNDNARNDSSKISRGSHSLRVDSIEMPVCEKEMAEAVSFSATGLSSPEKITYWKKRSRFLTADTQYTYSDESIGELDLVDWTDEEKFMFIRALGMYGKNFAKISQSLGTKSREQCKAFFCKARKCLSLDQIHTGARELVKVENSASDSPLKPFSASRTELEHQKTRTAAEVHGKREVELHQVSTVLKSVFRGSDAKENDISTQVPNQKKLKREMNSEGQLNFELNAMREGSMVLNSKPGEELRPYAIAEKSTAKPGDRKIFGKIITNASSLSSISSLYSWKPFVLDRGPRCF